MQQLNAGADVTALGAGGLIYLARASRRSGRLALPCRARAAIDIADRNGKAHAQDIEAYRRESKLHPRRHSVAARIPHLCPDLGFPRRSRIMGRDSMRAPPRGRLASHQRSVRALRRRTLTDWRLFQLAFILAHVPTFASRMPEFADRIDPDRDELTPAFFISHGRRQVGSFLGLLVSSFLDRLRGKHRGVTALVRYPLRLLTLQQARRLMRILTNAER